MKNNKYYCVNQLNFKKSFGKLSRKVFSVTSAVNIFISLLFVSCASKQLGHTQGVTEIIKPIENPTEALAKSSWYVTYLALADESVIDLSQTNRNPTLLIDTTGKISGSTGCNRYFASIKKIDNYFKIENIGTTRMACKGALMTQESVFLKALGLVVFFEQQNDILLLGERNRNIIMKLRPASSISKPAS
jgi:heat shock protein HslJ